MNDITKLATQLAQSQLDTKTDEVIYNVDVAYWQVVSLKEKLLTLATVRDMLEQLEKELTN